RFGYSLRQRQQCRRCAHQFPAQQDRQSLLAAADPYRPGCRIHGQRPSRMKPLTLRTKLTLFYSITVSVLLTSFALIYYRVLSVGLDQALTQELIDRTSG